MKKVTFCLLLLLIIVSIGLFSCSGDHDSAVNDDVELLEEVVSEEVTYILPSPLQIVSLFKNAGLEYVGGLTNPKENVTIYNSKSSQKINFGIYGADMSYAITNNQTQEAINYLNALRKMSEKIWMTDVLNSIGIAERLERNVGNLDSLTSIMVDLQMRMDDYLEENGSSYTGSIIFAGAWIESMYLAVNANKNTNEKILNRLSEQSVIIENIIGAIKQANEDNEYNDLIVDLETIELSFKSIKDNKEGGLTASQLAELRTTVTQIRNKLIKG